MPANISLGDKQRKQRARWLRNKRAERQRLRKKQEAEEARKPLPVVPSQDFLRQVWAERDNRLASFPLYKAPLPGPKFFKNSSNFSSQALVCDVWAAEVILAAENPDAKITGGQIARFLIKEGRDHGVTPASLRTKVCRSRHIVRFLEEAPIWNQPGKYWPKFPESMPELGSGLQQHVDQVMAVIGAYEAHKMRG